MCEIKLGVFNCRREELLREGLLLTKNLAQNAKIDKRNHLEIEEILSFSTSVAEFFYSDKHNSAKTYFGQNLSQPKPNSAKLIPVSLIQSIQ